VLPNLAQYWHTGDCGSSGTATEDDTRADGLEQGDLSAADEDRGADGRKGGHHE